MKRAALLLALPLIAACDDRQAVHPLDVDWNRMLEQPRARAYDESAAFPDGRAMRVPPPGAIPHDRPPAERPAVTRAVLERGRERFEVFCAACHGIDGSGRSVVATKMVYRPPPSLHEPRLRAYSTERIEQIIERGYGFMPSYADALVPDERAAVAAYVQALQLSRHAEVAALPEEVRARLEKEVDR